MFSTWERFRETYSLSSWAIHSPDECMNLVIIYRKCFRSYRAPLVALHDRHPLCSCEQPSKRHLHESRDFTTVVCRCRRYWIDLHLYLNSSSHWKLRTEMKSEWFRMRHAIFHEQKRTVHSRVTAPRRTYWVMVQYIAMAMFRNNQYVRKADGSLLLRVTIEW